MEEDPLKEHVNSLGLNWQLFEALQYGDLQTLILGILSEENSDPLLASVMQLMLAQNQAMSRVTAEQGEAKGQRTSDHSQSDVGVSSSASGQSSAVRATLRRVARMLGACSTCCGEESSCPECQGSGKPGSVPSIASAEELRAWLLPALSRMGMQISNPAPSDVLAPMENRAARQLKEVFRS